MALLGQDHALPLDQIKARKDASCPCCGGDLKRDGIMDGSRYPDQCSRPWYTCECCGEGFDGDMLKWHEEVRP